jgi:hypothetical protein
MARAKDLGDYKRKVIIEGSNPKTTKASLEEYLSEYQIDSIDGPLFEHGKYTNIISIPNLRQLLLRHLLSLYFLSYDSQLELRGVKNQFVKY